MDNTIWFITGSSRGLGRALALSALNSGAKVVATARNPASIQDLVDEYGSERLLTLPLDVTDYAASLAAAAQTIAQFGKIDIVVNNAGYADVQSVEDTNIESFKAQMETNLMGVVNVSKAFVPIMREQGRGHIFQISSLGSRAASPGLGAYQAAKYAVAGFSGVLAAEVKPFGVKVTCLEPGAMETEWASGGGEVSEAYLGTVGRRQEVFRKALEGRVTRVERVAAVIERLWREEDPPVRCLVGGDAVEYGRVFAEGLRASDEKWAEVGESASL